MSVQVFDVKTGLKTIDTHFPLCSEKRFSTNLMIKLAFEVVIKALNFDFKCPLKKGSKIKVNAMEMKNFELISRVLEPNGKRKTVLLVTGGSPPVPLVSITVYYMRI